MARAILLSVFVLLAAAAAVHARPQRKLVATAPLSSELPALAKARNGTASVKPAAKVQAAIKASPKPSPVKASPKPSAVKASPKPASTKPAGAKIRETEGTGSNGTSLSRARDTAAAGTGGLDVGFGSATSGARVRDTNAEGTGGLDLGNTGGQDLARTQAPKETPAPAAAPKSSPKPMAPKASPKPSAVKASPKPSAVKASPKPGVPKASPKPAATSAARVRDTNSEGTGGLDLGNTGGQVAGH